MPERPTTLTGASGEHYVAFALSALGYSVGLTRGGSPLVDLLVGSKDGKSSISIQVKTSNWAYREYKRKKEKDHWEWDVGRKGLEEKGESFFYAFVDLKWSDDGVAQPDVFIVPSSDVVDWLNPEWKRFMFWIWKVDKALYLNRWDRISSILDG